MGIPGYMVTDAIQNPEDEDEDSHEEELPSSPSLPIFRILALHGSGSNGMDFAEILAPLQDLLRDEHLVDLQITSPWAPWSKKKVYGSSWFTVPVGQQAYNAFEYIGFDASFNMISTEMEEQAPDLIVAHSDGAVLIAALLALKRIPKHPRLGYVLNGVGWPSPFGDELKKLGRFDDKNASPGPKMMIIMGEEDETNPPHTALRVKQAFSKAGFRVSACTHPGGHDLPIDNDIVKNELADWILDVS